MTKEHDDPPFDQEDLEAISLLSPADIEAIDQALLAHCDRHWKKVAFVVAYAMDSVSYPDIPDIYYAERVRHLVAADVIEATGNLSGMRTSEVRLKPAE